MIGQSYRGISTDIDDFSVSLMQNSKMNLNEEKKFEGLSPVGLNI
jgi:hypothetical protein